MPKKMQAKFCREKRVLITVYEEKPRRKRVSAASHHHHHHQYLHLHDASARKGYNRRALLLHYSQTLRLRESAQRSAAAESTPLLPKPKPKPKPAPSNNKQQPTAETAVQIRKASSAKTPTCLGDWKVLIPSFIRSLMSLKDKKEKKKKKQSESGMIKMKVLMKNIQVQKKRGFVPRLCSTLQKHM